MALTAAAIVAAALSACGSSAKDATVVKVAGNPISKSQMEHWMRVEAVLTYQVIPKQAAPSGVFPDPPSYSACIAWLVSPKGPIAARTSKFTTAQLKRHCEERLAGLKKKALTFLISNQWLLGEAKELGVTPTEAEVEKALRYFRQIQTPKAGEFQRYLNYAHMSLADAQFIQRLTVAGNSVQNKILKAGSEDRVRQGLASFNAKWIPRTDCKAGYVVPGCKQYSGTEPPP